MKPFILYYAEQTTTDSEPFLLDYSYELNLSVIPDTSEPAINLATQNLETFTKAGKEPTDFGNLRIQSILDGATITKAIELKDSSCAKRSSFLSGETQTFTNGEATDKSNQVSRIAKRMSLESLTESREATDVK